MNLPKDFVTNTLKILNLAEYRELENSLEEPSPVSIRINPFKTGNSNNFSFDEQYSRVPWSKYGYYLGERLTFTFDPFFHAGIYYVQEASSMFLEQAIKQYLTTPVSMLDLCAAPGGKSTHLRSLLPDGSLLVANEVIRNRSQILAENLTKWGNPQTIVTNDDPEKFSQIGIQFDAILADVPCSGEGMFRKDSGAIGEWSTDNVEICRQRQRRIIADIWPALNPGGILLYSTCTYNTRENEENIEWIKSELGAVSLSLSVPMGEWGITGNLLGIDSPVYRFFPHKAKGEGFFMAILQKNGAKAMDMQNKRKEGRNRRKTDAPLSYASIRKQYPVIEEWIESPENFHYAINNNRIIALPFEILEAYSCVSGNLHLVHAGVPVGEVKGKDVLPAHSLAMSTIIRKDAFPVKDIAYEQAIAYLRKEAIVLDSDIPRGYILLTYKGVPLGFVKNIGNRANNLYPGEWRIRSGYFPEQIKLIDYCP